MMQIDTNKGTFNIRYSYNSEHGQIVVVDTADMFGPFEGTYGDEIPVTEEMKAKYDIKINEK